MSRRSLVFAVLVCSLVVARMARAQDQFEIQVYDPTSDPKGHGGIQLHLNYVPVGVVDTTPPELPHNHFFHATLEPSYGVTDRWEIGGYLQGAAGPDFGVGFAGVKVRSLVRFPVSDALAFAVNGELSYVPPQFEPNRFGSEIRPIMEWKFAGRWLIDFDPIFDIDIAGKFAGLPQFEPCIALRLRINERWLISLEYYTWFGTVNHLLPWAQEYQSPFVEADVDVGWGFDIHFGLGAGLTPVSNPVEVNSILSKEL